MTRVVLLAAELADSSAVLWAGESAALMVVSMVEMKVVPMDSMGRTTVALKVEYLVETMVVLLVVVKVVKMVASSVASMVA